MKSLSFFDCSDQCMPCRSPPDCTPFCEFDLSPPWRLPGVSCGSVVVMVVKVTERSVKTKDNGINVDPMIWCGQGNTLGSWLGLRKGGWLASCTRRETCDLGREWDVKSEAGEGATETDCAADGRDSGRERPQHGARFRFAQPAAAWLARPRSRPTRPLHSGSWAHRTAPHFICLMVVDWHDDCVKAAA